MALFVDIFSMADFQVLMEPSVPMRPTVPVESPMSAGHALLPPGHPQHDRPRAFNNARAWPSPKAAFCDGIWKQFKELSSRWAFLVTSVDLTKANIEAFSRFANSREVTEPVNESAIKQLELAQDNMAKIAGSDALGPAG